MQLHNTNRQISKEKVLISNKHRLSNSLHVSPHHRSSFSSKIKKVSDGGGEETEEEVVWLFFCGWTQMTRSNF